MKCKVIGVAGTTPEKFWNSENLSKGACDLPFPDAGEAVTFYLDTSTIEHLGHLLAAMVTLKVIEIEPMEIFTREDPKDN